MIASRSSFSLLRVRCCCCCAVFSLETNQGTGTMTKHSLSVRVAANRFACALFGALTLTCSAAPSYPKEGKYDYTACYSGTNTVLQTAAKNGAGATRFVGNTHSNIAGGPFDMLAYTCVGMSATTDGKVNSSYYCQVVDLDGDKFMAHGMFDGTKTTTDAFGGTGKYEGMVRNGTSESPGPYPTAEPGTFTGCNHQTGTYKMK